MKSKIQEIQIKIKILNRIFQCRGAKSETRLSFLNFFFSRKRGGTTSLLVNQTRDYEFKLTNYLPEVFSFWFQVLKVIWSIKVSFVLILLSCLVLSCPVLLSETSLILKEMSLFVGYILLSGVDNIRNSKNIFIVKINKL